MEPSAGHGGRPRGGCGSRFGGGKLASNPSMVNPSSSTSSIDSRRPGWDDVVVVLGDDADDTRDRRSTGAGNGASGIRTPGARLSSSVRIGIGAVSPDAEAALVVLGDQPLGSRRRRSRRCSTSWRDPERPIVVPRYDRDRGRNPVLLHRSAFALVDATDRRPWTRTRAGGAPGARCSRSQSMATNPVRYPRGPGRDAGVGPGRARSGQRRPGGTPREVPDGTDFYAPVSGLFRADPTRTDEPTLAVAAGPRPARRDVAGHRGGCRTVCAADRPGAGPERWVRHRE